MVPLVVPYIIPLFLGMTFDARNSKPGIDIYDMKDVQNPQITNQGETTSKYKVTTTMSEVLSALEVSGDLSLKIKTGLINGEGAGSFIKNERNYHNSVMVVTRMLYKSKILSLPDDAEPRENWQKQETSVLGTHYVSSINYGAEMIACASFIVHNSSDMDNVRGQVNAAFGTSGDGSQLVAEGKMEKLRDQVKNKAKLEISYYGTVPLDTIPNTIEGLRELIEKFNEQLDKTDMKKGVPLTVSLMPLTQLAGDADKQRFQFIKNEILEEKLSDFEEDIDELRQARLELGMYARKLPYDLDAVHAEELGNLFKNISFTLQKYYEVVWTMDLSKGPEQLDPAFETYNYDGEDIEKRFKYMVEDLIYKLDREVKRKKVASDTYVHWGKQNCTAKGVQVLYEGFAFTSSEEGIGGLASYNCFPKSPAKSYEIKADRYYSHLAGVRYQNIEKTANNPFKGPNNKKILGKGIPCAKCYPSEAASIAMFAAVEECPITWDIMYKGYLMSSRYSRGLTTEYICVDETPASPYDMSKSEGEQNSLALSVVQTKGSLPTDKYRENTLIPCVVCAVNSNALYA